MCKLKKVSSAENTIEYLTHLYEEWSIAKGSIHFSSVSAGKILSLQFDILM